MYIVNKNKTQIINAEQVTVMYIGGDECSIKADFVTGKGCLVARYDSHEAATAAMEMLGKAMGHTEVFFFPEDDVIRAHIKENEQKWHHATGKKMKGHGGS